MDRRLRCLLPVLPLLLLNACGGGKGSSAAPPANFQAISQDQALTATWTDDPTLDYWIFVGPPGTSASNFVNTAGAYAIPHATSPYSVATLVFNGVPQGLTNGQSYDISINARSGGGPGGPSTAVIHAQPRASGGAWTTGTALVNASDNLSDDLLSLTYGVPYYGNNGVLAATGAAATFVAAGKAGALFYTTQNSDGVNFTYHPTSSGLAAGTTLNAVSYDASLGFLTAGSNGLASASLDGITWTPQTSGVSYNINGLSSLGGSWLATGDACNLLSVALSGTTTQYTGWTSYGAGLIAAYPTQCTGSTPASLYTALVGSLGGVGYVLVGGSQGLFSYSGAVTSATPGWTTPNLTLPAGVTAASVTFRSMVFGAYTPSATTTTPNPVALPLFIAVGDYVDSTGTVQPLILYSYDLANWASATLPAGLAGVHLRSVSAARDPATGQISHLSAVGDGGVILSTTVVNTTITGSTATQQVSLTPAQTWTRYTGTTPNATLNAVVFGHFGFEAVGAAGTNLNSF